MMNKKLQSAFTLIEMAIVLVILGFVLSALLLPLQAQRELAFQNETATTLDNAKSALLGFAQANGRLPCPATNTGSAVFPDDTGNANPIAGGVCAQQSGFLPGATLGVQPTDAQGYAIDAWRNRIRYAVTQTSVNPATGAAVMPRGGTFTTANGMSNAGIANLNQFATIRVCNTASAFTTTCSAPPVAGEVNYLINNAVAVIYSVGATGGGAAGGADEAENLNAAAVGAPALLTDTVFVSHDPVAAGVNEFDHQVVWISPFTLYNAMIQAGQLH